MTHKYIDIVDIFFHGKKEKYKEFCNTFYNASVDLILKCGYVNPRIDKSEMSESCEWIASALRAFYRKKGFSAPSDSHFWICAVTYYSLVHHSPIKDLGEKRHASDIDDILAEDPNRVIFYIICHMIACETEIRYGKFWPKIMTFFNISSEDIFNSIKLFRSAKDGNDLIWMSANRFRELYGIPPYQSRDEVELP